jgi:hypothetical protein
MLSNHSASCRFAALTGSILLIFALPACGGGATSPPAASSLAPSSAHMDSTRCSSSVVYVATQHYPASVYIYNQSVHGKRPKPCGQISGLSMPQGLFVDGSGDLWVAVEGNCTSQFSSVAEFAPGGSTPIETLKDPAGIAWDVVVDAHSGTVYVTNVSDYSDKSNCTANKNGAVEVYAHGSTTPTSVLRDWRMSLAVDDALDDQGNLYVTYEAPGSGPNGILEWRHAKGTAKDLGITLPGLGGIQTTATGALLVCDQSECGNFAPGSTRMTNRFGTKTGPYGVALDQSEKNAWAQVPFGDTQRFVYPGPDKRANESFFPPYGGDLGIAVSRPAPPGKPY